MKQFAVTFGTKRNTGSKRRVKIGDKNNIDADSMKANDYGWFTKSQ